jgi:hypothetical protein
MNKDLIPSPTFYSRRYWEGCSNNKLLFQKCAACSSVQFYPRMICSNCWSKDLIWYQSKGHGEIISYTIVHRPPSADFSNEIPYVIVFVRLGEGFNMIGYLRNWSNMDDISIGRSVVTRFECISQDIFLPVFELR